MTTLTLKYSQYLNDTAVRNIEQWSKDWFSYLLGWYITIYIYKFIYKNNIYINWLKIKSLNSENNDINYHNIIMDIIYSIYYILIVLTKICASSCGNTMGASVNHNGLKGP